MPTKQNNPSTEAAGFSTLEGRVFSRGSGKTAAWEGVDCWWQNGLGATWEFRAIGQLEVGRTTHPVLLSIMIFFLS